MVVGGLCEYEGDAAEEAPGWCCAVVCVGPATRMSLDAFDETFDAVRSISGTPPPKSRRRRGDMLEAARAQLIMLAAGVFDECCRRRREQRFE